MTAMFLQVCVPRTLVGTSAGASEVPEHHLLLNLAEIVSVEEHHERGSIIKMRNGDHHHVLDGYLRIGEAIIGS